MKLTIQDVPPSLNKVLRMHWAAKRKLKKQWDAHVWENAFLGKSLELVRPGTKMRCAIVLHHARLYDKDNAYGACKVLVDSLKGFRLIFEDSAEWLELTVEQAKCPHKQRHTVIEIEAGK